MARSGECRGAQPAHDGRRRVGVLRVVLLPEVGARPRQARRRIDERDEEVGGAAHDRPEAGVERLVAELAERGLGRHEHHPRLVDLMKPQEGASSPVVQ